MATATIANTPWAGIALSPPKAQVKVLTHSLARPGGAFVAAELTLLAIPVLETAWGGHSFGTLFPIAFCALFFHINQLDKSIVSSQPSQFWMDLLESVVLGLLASTLLFRVLPGLAPRVDIVVAAGLLIALLPVVLRPLLRNLVTRGKFVEEILIVGTGDLPAKLHRALGRGTGHAKSNPQTLSPFEGLADRGSAVDLAGLNELVARDQISRVVIAELSPQSRERLAAALLDSRLRGLRVNDAVDFYEELSGKIWVEALNPQWFLYTNGFNRSRARRFRERCFDVTSALLLILLAAPLLVLIAIVIKFDAAGPVLFRQIRVGLHGKTFVIYKFRSMRDDAELEAGSAWAADGDERVTRVGRFLRLFRLDEIPQE